MISAANNGQHTLSDAAARNIGLAAAQEVPASKTAAQLPEVQPPDASASLSHEESIPTWKRLLDLTLIFLTLPLWLSAMGVVSVWILLVSPGPLLYRQERIGYRGRRFMILKLRTMHVNSEALSHEGYFEKLMQSNCPMTKLDSCGDARLIRGGRILRALALDELPQLFNVLRSEMSLVVRPEAEGNYTRVYWIGSSMLIRRPLRDCEKRLDPTKFFRARRDCILNLEHVKHTRIVDLMRYVFVLQDGTEVTLSRRQSLVLRKSRSL